MESRRDFIKKAALLAAGFGGLPACIQKALAIDPALGSTFLDAEHVVILMQENRSFDHSFGALRGVRGFNDPRAIPLPNGNPVWLQSNAAGETYAPFRLNLKDTKATWMGSLPHSWANQVDARNGGLMDRWLVAKRSGHREYAHLPTTLGFYNRDDLPFYYALADAFTLCDQNFCSSLTGTTPNRLYLWTGTIRAHPSIEAKANVRNSDVDYGSEASWTTFPERLEANGISWKIYQNELSLPMGFTSDEEKWLGNFTDNSIEWFTQYHVRFSSGYRSYLARREPALVEELRRLEAEAAQGSAKEIRTKHAELEHVRQERRKWTEANFAALPAREQNLHRKAFVTNQGDPHYHELTKLSYRDGATQREMEVPKGDVLHQFRTDVRSGQLPAVSWIVAPENFSDHPGAPWYGAWYLSEVMDILTQNPEVWKKTIFIVAYDENDGYFDHVPPFVAPAPGRPETGKTSAGIDPSVEHVRWEQEVEYLKHNPDDEGRAGSIGLGFRVPLMIVSPWSRGGYVCSQVFDHTSVIQLLEKIWSHKTGRAIREENITAWRRAVCGDLTSAFRPYQGEKIPLPKPVEKDAFLESIHQAQFKQLPSDFRKFSAAEITKVRSDPTSSALLPVQEPGTRPSCALPYELTVDGRVSADRKSFVIRFAVGREKFGERAAGAPFLVYAPGRVRADAKNSSAFVEGRTWSYAVTAGDSISDSYLLSDFADGSYHLRVQGPNGFFREFRGTANDPSVGFAVEPALGPANGTAMSLRVTNRDPQRVPAVEVEDRAYGGGRQTLKSDQLSLTLALGRSHGWYDFSVRVPGVTGFEQRFAGRIETGEPGISDPYMGRVADRTGG